MIIELSAGVAGARTPDGGRGVAGLPIGLADDRCEAGHPPCGDAAQWVRQPEVNTWLRPGVASEESAEIRRLKRENAELRQVTSSRRPS